MNSSDKKDGMLERLRLTRGVSRYWLRVDSIESLPEGTQKEFVERER